MPAPATAAVATKAFAAFDAGVSGNGRCPLPLPAVFSEGAGGGFGAGAGVLGKGGCGGVERAPSTPTGLKVGARRVAADSAPSAAAATAALSPSSPKGFKVDA